MEWQGRHPCGADICRVFGGVLIVGLGLVLLADRLHLLEPGYSGHGWPLVVLALGVVKLVAPAGRQGRARARRMAAWLLVVGAWGLINEYRLWEMDYATSWPLLLVYLGVDIVWRTVDQPDPAARETTR